METESRQSSLPFRPKRGKAFGSYFKEFLMLFLAVFLGFLAEDFREDHQEADKADELAHSFYAELKEDSAAIAFTIKKRENRERALVYLRKYFKDSSLTHVSRAFTIQFYIGFFMFSRTIFHPQNVLLEQIRTSGSQEYFKDPDIRRLTGKLTEAIVKIQMRNDVERNYLYQYFHPITQEQMDMDWMDEVSKFADGNSPDSFGRYAEGKVSIPFQLADPETINRRQIVNMVGLQRHILKYTRENQYETYFQLNRELLEKLRRAYHIQ